MTAKTSHSHIKYGIFLLLLAIIVGICVVYFTQSPSITDPLLRTAFSRIEAIDSYRQSVRTVAHFGDRSLLIEGVYDVDRGKNAYASYSTTSLLRIEPNETSTFRQATVSIGSTVYVSIQTDDPELKKKIITTDGWAHFKSDSIPKTFTGIAISGPVLDDIKLLEHNGRYVIESSPSIKASMNGIAMTHYSFALRHPLPAISEANPTLKALTERIGIDGSIGVWIEGDGFVRTLVFDNASYHSTTTISDVNALPDIVAPVSSVR